MNQILPKQLLLDDSWPRVYGAQSCQLPAQQPVTGLILSGGGARAAYQVGVLKGIADILPDKQENPFPVIVGTSAGAINAVALACAAMDFSRAVQRLLAVWQGFSSDRIYRTDWRGVLGQSMRFVSQHMLGFGRDNPVALLDNAPLKSLLLRELDFSGINLALARRKLAAVAVTAFSYQSAEATTFYQARQKVEPWRRFRRIGIPARLNIDHLMASSAIPLIFPPVSVGNVFYGDGAVRQAAPISPALHLGANRVLIVSVNCMDQQPVVQAGSPSLAQIGSHLLNSTFSDHLETDLELLQRLNHLGDMLTPEQRQLEHGLSPVEALVIAPSKSIDDIAVRHRKQMATALRMFLRGSGATRANGGGVLSYLLFEQCYCNELIELGYNDALAQKEQLLRFLLVAPGLTESRRFAVTPAAVAAAVP